MSRWNWLFLFAALVLGIAGCGRSASQTAAQHAAKEVGQGHYETAIGLCNEALRDKPTDDEVLVQRGRAYHCRNLRGDVERAIADFSEAIRLAPKKPQAYFCRSLAYRDQGDLDASLADEKSNRELDSELKEVYARLSETMAKTSSPQKEPAQVPAPKEASHPEIKKSASSILNSTDELRDSVRTRLRHQEEDADPTFAAPGLPGTTRPRGANPGQMRSPLGALSPDDASLDEPSASPQRPARPAYPAAALPPRRAAARPAADPYSFEFPAPVSPFQQSGSGLPTADGSPPPQSAYQRQYPTPFPQRAPRPTGFVEEQPQGPFRSQPRNPYSPPANHSPGAYHDDLNP